jgi:hypothetical protein
VVRPSRAAAVKDGRLLRPPEGLVLDGREHGGRLVCVGIDCRRRLMPPLIVDRREISDRGVTAARIVEAFDELESGAARLGLGLEPAPIEQVAFEGCEETLAHGVVVRVADRAHRRAHAGLAAALAELDRGVLRPLIGVMDHAPGPSCRQRHVQRIEHQLFSE